MNSNFNIKLYALCRHRLQISKSDIYIELKSIFTSDSIPNENTLDNWFSNYDTNSLEPKLETFSNELTDLSVKQTIDHLLYTVELNDLEKKLDEKQDKLNQFKQTNLGFVQELDLRKKLLYNYKERVNRLESENERLGAYETRIKKKVDEIRSLREKSDRDKRELIGLTYENAQFKSKINELNEIKKEKKVIKSLLWDEQRKRIQLQEKNKLLKENLLSTKLKLEDNEKKSLNQVEGLKNELNKQLNRAKQLREKSTRQSEQSHILNMIISKYKDYSVVLEEELESVKKTVRKEKLMIELKKALDQKLALMKAKSLAGSNQETQTDLKQVANQTMEFKPYIELDQTTMLKIKREFSTAGYDDNDYKPFKKACY